MHDLDKEDAADRGEELTFNDENDHSIANGVPIHAAPPTPDSELKWL